jgi:polygalacturonase
MEEINMNKIKLSLLVIYSFIVGACSQNSFENNAEELNNQGWKKVDSILSRIVVPEFIENEFFVDNYLKNEGRKSFVNAVNRAIADCNSKGGGKVVISKGKHISNGPINLLSNVNLHLEEGALIKFGVDPLDYTPLVLVRWEGTLCYMGKHNLFGINGKGEMMVKTKMLIK